MVRDRISKSKEIGAAVTLDTHLVIFMIPSVSANSQAVLSTVLWSRASVALTQHWMSFAIALAW